ncbi:MAG: hypothetical protein JNN09_08550 [Alphaproteobacteria bacterium]|nr:hypothetical protein [Alphaproteobacteria bacterium]
MSHFSLVRAFGCTVKEAVPLSTEFGLSIQLTQPTDLKEAFGIGYEGHTNADICRLADQHGVLVIRNAFVTAPPDLKLSGKVEQGSLVQDFFHWDSPVALPNRRGCATVLFKPLSKGREAPTLYARMSDVREALKQIDTTSFPGGVQDALQDMQRSGYFFGLGGEENESRQAILFKYPSLTEDVAKLIPPDKIYRHHWESGDRAVVIHSVRQGEELLHARPASCDAQNCVNGLRLFPN